MNNIICQYCNSFKVVKHGSTSVGRTRYRCRYCGKTWTPEKNGIAKADFVEIAEAYLNGRTCRDLVDVVHSSPLRINRKIREFLIECPPWEEYLDSVVKSHEPRMIYLFGRRFSCACEPGISNDKFVAFAVDGLSTLILGYEVGPVEADNTWRTLLSRMRSRGIECSSFMATGAIAIEKACALIYPEASFKVSYHRAFRDKELSCCLSHMKLNNKLLHDSLKIYNSLENQNLVAYLKKNNEKKLQEILFASQDDFIARLSERFKNKSNTRMEAISSNFQARFEKFHMIKSEPLPMINGWVALQMLKPLESGFSRLAIYAQVPLNTSFRLFRERRQPDCLTLRDDSAKLRAFVVEIAARTLQLPVLFSECEMKFDRCALF